MATLTIRLDYEPQKFVSEPVVGINLDKLEVQDAIARAEILPDRILYLTCHFVVAEKDTSINLQLLAPDGLRVRFRDFPADLTGHVTWKAGVANRDYFKYRRFFLESEQ